MKGFPARLIDFIQCNKGCGGLETEKVNGNGTLIFNGALKCPNCNNIYRISDGILEMLDKAEPMDSQSQFEMRIRDEIAKDSKEILSGNVLHDKLEVYSTLKRLGETKGKSVLELGCGSGRFTRKLAENSGCVLAIDFSHLSLLLNRDTLPRTMNVGLVLADASKLILKPNSFDLALSTFYSNIPIPETRRAVTKCVSSSLKPKGIYVLSAHHYTILDKLRGNPVAGKYENGIFYQCFTAEFVKKEMKEFFSKFKTDTICIWIPYISRIKLMRTYVSRVSERIPLLSRLGSLLLVTAIKT